jgi:hypothetical protein
VNYRRTIDVLLTVVLPVLLGIGIYLTAEKFPIPFLLKDHAADGLWAYAFASSILIVWERHINMAWMIIALLAAVSFELLQYIHFIKGTGDIYDMLTYAIGFSIALLSNTFLKKFFNSETINHATN